MPAGSAPGRFGRSHQRRRPSAVAPPSARVERSRTATRLRTRWVVLLSSGLLVAGAGAWWIEQRTRGCDIEIAASGRYEGDQLDEIHCYLAAQAGHDMSLLRSVTLTSQVKALNNADLGYTRDAHAGVPRVHITQGATDSTDADVVIRYATGRSQPVHMHDEAGPESLSPSWRMALTSS